MSCPASWSSCDQKAGQSRATDGLPSVTGREAPPGRRTSVVPPLEGAGPTFGRGDPWASGYAPGNRPAPAPPSLGDAVCAAQHPEGAADDNSPSRPQRVEEARGDRRGDRASRAAVLDQDGDREVAAEGDEPCVRGGRVAAAVLGGPALAGDQAGQRSQRRAGARVTTQRIRCGASCARFGYAPGPYGGGRCRAGAGRASARRPRWPRPPPWPAGWRRCGPGRSSSPRGRPGVAAGRRPAGAGAPEPEVARRARQAPGASRDASETNAVLHDCAKSVGEGHGARGPALEVLNSLPSTVIVFGQSTVSVVFSPARSSAVVVTTLNVEPGG